jgi:hypothetical protein
MMDNLKLLTSEYSDMAILELPKIKINIFLNI